VSEEVHGGEWDAVSACESDGGESNLWAAGFGRGSSLRDFYIFVMFTHR